ncbi:BLUF domain-containing protein [Lacinutrix mariniflava]|uniref:BLUF domain-containing protein n=1 Tax=Lacinutrix mariniflava TaxID=342955 RepID=UPI0006E25F47|nr:BLUF domain-containing protein [Lacinutrix mariniflava]
MLKSICYKSQVKPTLSILEFESLFNQTQTSNDKSNITGVLVKSKDIFFQIIEGDVATIDSLFEKIKKDNRHSDIIELLNKPISQLSFKAFDTGYTLIDDIDELYGLQIYITDLQNNHFENSTLFLKIIEDLLTTD